jgi:hypothetical protein
VSGGDEALTFLARGTRAPYRAPIRLTDQSFRSTPEEDAMDRLDPPAIAANIARAAIEGSPAVTGQARAVEVPRHQPRVPPAARPLDEGVLAAFAYNTPLVV